MKCLNCNYELEEWEEYSQNLKGIKYKMKSCMNCGAIYVPEPLNVEFIGLKKDQKENVKNGITSLFTI